MNIEIFPDDKMEIQVDKSRNSLLITFKNSKNEFSFNLSHDQTEELKNCLMSTIDEKASSLSVNSFLFNGDTFYYITDKNGSYMVLNENEAYRLHERLDCSLFPKEEQIEYIINERDSLAIENEKLKEHIEMLLDNMDNDGSEYHSYKDFI